MHARMHRGMHACTHRGSEAEGLAMQKSNIITTSSVYQHIVTTQKPYDAHRKQQDLCTERENYSKLRILMDSACFSRRKFSRFALRSLESEALAIHAPWNDCGHTPLDGSHKLL